MGVYTSEQIESSYEEMTASVVCDCTFLTEFVGGQPAQLEGIQAFVKHHLGLSGLEAENAVKRIRDEEVGERELAPDGEVKEKESYAVNVLRKTNNKPWIAHWMVKACIKQAASRIGLFQEKRGTKGNFSEGGRVRAARFSRLDPLYPHQIFIVGDDTKRPAESKFVRFHGRVSTPKGEQSIVHDSEVVLPGSRFSFSYQFLPGEVSEEDMVKVLAMMANCGLGSVRSLERGNFRIDQAVIDVKGLRKQKKGKEQTKKLNNVLPEQAQPARAKATRQ